MGISDLPDEPEYLRKMKQAIDGLSKPMKDFEHLNRPLRQWDEMRRQFAPIREWEEFQRKLDPVLRWEDIQRRTASHRHWEELKRDFESARQWDELQNRADRHAQRMMFENFPDLHAIVQQGSFRDALKATETATAAISLNLGLDRIVQHREWLDRLQRQATGGLHISQFAHHLERADPVLNSLAEVQRMWDVLRDSFERHDNRGLKFDEEAAQQAEDAVEYIAESASAEPTLNAVFFQIAIQIQAQPNESVQLILWAYFKKIVEFIVNAVISAVISVVVAQQMQTASTQSATQAAKTVKEAARAAVGSSELLSEYRFVSAKSLTVRINPNARSPKLADLHFGTAVKLLRRERDFALVVWSNTDSGAEIQGWVFARYLKKFN